MISLRRNSSGKYRIRHFSGLARRLAEAADRGVGHGAGELLRSGVSQAGRCISLHRLLGADPAGRALAAAFVLEEAHQVEGRGLEVVLVGEHHHGMAADEAALLLELAEVERHVGHARRQDAARGTARQIGAEPVARRHAAAELVDQLAAR